MTELSAYAFSPLRGASSPSTAVPARVSTRSFWSSPSGNIPRKSPSGESSMSTVSGRRSNLTGPRGPSHSPVAMVVRRWCSRIPAASRSITCSAARWM